MLKFKCKSKMNIPRILKENFMYTKSSDITVLVFDLFSHMLLNLLYLQPIYYTGFGLYRISFKDI